MALAGHPGELSWSAPAAWLYLLFVASLLPLGLYAWFARHTLRRRVASTDV